MATEDRKQARNMLRADHQVLLCHVRLEDKHISICTIFDISDAGAGIAMPAPLPLGANVDLRYQDQAGEDITVSGKVAWCTSNCVVSDQTPKAVCFAGYRGGISFEPTEQRSRELLVGALRPHLDLETLCV